MNENTGFKLPVNVEEIQQLLPHRYPFLLVDRVLELTPDKHVKALDRRAHV